MTLAPTRGYLPNTEYMHRYSAELFINIASSLIRTFWEADPSSVNNIKKSIFLFKECDFKILP